MFSRKEQMLLKNMDHFSGPSGEASGTKITRNSWANCVEIAQLKEILILRLSPAQLRRAQPLKELKEFATLAGIQGYSPLDSRNHLGIIKIFCRN
jgi:hypothetical protein